MPRPTSAVIPLLLAAGTATAEPALSPQVELVARLYQQYACEAVIESPSLPGCALTDQPTSTLLRFFAPDLAEAIVQDTACAEKEKEVCRLDFMPLWDSQDPGGATVSLRPSKNAAVVIATVRYPREKRELTYSLANTERGWRITDIGFMAGKRSLMGILSPRPAPKAGPQPSN